MALQDIHRIYFENLLGQENVKSDKMHKLAYSYDATREEREPDMVFFIKFQDFIHIFFNSQHNTTLCYNATTCKTTTSSSWHHWDVIFITIF